MGGFRKRRHRLLHGIRRRGCRYWPVYAGEIQARALGCACFAFDEQGREIVDVVGELVITEPMPSMPVKFWDDPEDQR